MTDKLQAYNEKIQTDAFREFVQKEIILDGTVLSLEATKIGWNECLRENTVSVLAEIEELQGFVTLELLESEIEGV